MKTLSLSSERVTNFLLVHLVKKNSGPNQYLLASHQQASTKALSKGFTVDWPYFKHYTRLFWIILGG